MSDMIGSPPPPSTALAARSRSLARLWVQIRKAAIPAIATGILGYGGGLVIPPSALYDRLFRQDPNDLSGTWFGGVAGAPATLKLTDDGQNLNGTLTLRYGLQGSRAIKVVGNHDSSVVLTGEWDATHELRIGLARKVGEQHGPDASYLLLMPEDRDTAYLVCRKDSMDVTDPNACRSLGKGSTFFARQGSDPK